VFPQISAYPRTLLGLFEGFGSALDRLLKSSM